jgi:hypothetical protein
MQHYVIKFVSDLRQSGGFLQVLRFLPPINLTNIILIENKLKSHFIKNNYIYLKYWSNINRVCTLTKDLQVENLSKYYGMQVATYQWKVNNSYNKGTRNKSTRGIAQLEPMGMPAVCWKIHPPDIQVAYNNLLKMCLFAKYFYSTKFDLNI